MCLDLKVGVVVAPNRSLASPITPNRSLNHSFHLHQLAVTVANAGFFSGRFATKNVTILMVTGLILAGK